MNIFNPCDNLNTLFFIQIDHYLEVFCYCHVVAFFETSTVEFKHPRETKNCSNYQMLNLSKVDPKDPRAFSCDKGWIQKWLKITN